jgi:hypothetical protein
MTFTGTFYFPKPVMGKTTGAVFFGQGRFHANPPDNLFEKENLRRILDADAVESDFDTAVLRFTDDSDALIGTARDPAAAAPAMLGSLLSLSRIRSQGNRSERREPPTPVPARARGSRSVLRSVRRRTPGLLQLSDGPWGRIRALTLHQRRRERAHLRSREEVLHEHGLAGVLCARRLPADIVPVSDAFDLVDAPAYTLTVDLRSLGKR